MVLDKTPKIYSSCCKSSCKFVNGIFRRSTERKATRFPMYDANIIKQNSHHEFTTNRVDQAMGRGEKPSKKRYHYETLLTFLRTQETVLVAYTVKIKFDITLATVTLTLG